MRGEPLDNLIEIALRDTEMPAEVLRRQPVLVLRRSPILLRFEQSFERVLLGLVGLKK
jgi:hypothetical protein